MKTPIIESLAVILPRYGKSLGGGAETLARELVTRLYQADPVHGESREEPTRVLGRLEVWTTCAQDHRTWANEHPEGESVEEGILVRRFPVDDRNVDTFLRAEFAMRDGRQLTIDEQMDWLRESVNSRALYRHIAEHGNEFQVLLFAPYLFGTSFWGPLIHPERSVLIPCLHDERYAYQDVFKGLFSAVRGLIFNAEPELILANEIYKTDFRPKGFVVGMGFDPPPLHNQHEVSSSTAAVSNGRTRPYILYSGRKEQGKNLDLLIEYHTRLARSAPETTPDLVIIGAGEISFLESLPNCVIDLGFVSEPEKLALMRNAIALCQPSTNESFSIVVMEAFLQHTPVIVHSHCAVTREHVVRSGGGLYFENALEYAAVVTCLADNTALRNQMGDAGCEFVREEYNWSRVVSRFVEALTHFGIISGEQPQDSGTL